MRTERNYHIDNIKCLLIFMVVFGHLLELFMKGRETEKLLYLLIYSFHMPLFAFTTGVFARFHPEKIRRHMIYPYVVFQLLYLLFANVALGEEKPLQLTTPYWLMWYLLAVIVWNLTLPLVQVRGWEKKLFLLGTAFLAAILIGFDEHAGYYLSVSRIVQFFPYFLLGVYSRGIQAWLGQRMDPGRKRRMESAAAVLAFLIVFLSIFLLASHTQEVRTVWFYGSLSYEKGDYSWQFRAFYCVSALGWLFAFLKLTPARKIPVLTSVGAHTMPVYLLHGFVIKGMDRLGILEDSEYALPLAMAMSAGIVLFLSSGMVLRHTGGLFCLPRRIRRPAV